MDDTKVNDLTNEKALMYNEFLGTDEEKKELINMYGGVKEFLDRAIKIDVDPVELLKFRQNYEVEMENEINGQVQKTKELVMMPAEEEIDIVFGEEQASKNEYFNILGYEIEGMFEETKEEKKVKFGEEKFSKRDIVDLVILALRYSQSVHSNGQTFQSAVRFVSGVIKDEIEIEKLPVEVQDSIKVVKYFKSYLGYKENVNPNDKANTDFLKEGPDLKGIKNFMQKDLKIGQDYENKSNITAAL